MCGLNHAVNGVDKEIRSGGGGGGQVIIDGNNMHFHGNS